MALLRALPVMLLAIAGGQIADRFDRRRVLVLMFSLVALASVGLLAVAVLDAPVWLVLPLPVPRGGRHGHRHPFAPGVAGRGWCRRKSSRMRPPGAVPSFIPRPSLVRWWRAFSWIASGRPRRLPWRLGSAGCWAWPPSAGMRYRRTKQAEGTISWKSVLAGIRFVWREAHPGHHHARSVCGPAGRCDLSAADLRQGNSESGTDDAGTALGILRSADAIGAIGMALCWPIDRRCGGPA